MYPKKIKIESNTVFEDWPLIRALIHSIKEKESKGNSTQTDYHRIIIASMPYFLYGTDNTLFTWVSY